MNLAISGSPGRARRLQPTDPAGMRLKARVGGHMKRFVLGIMAAAVLVSMALPAMAQTKTINAEMREATATVEAIEASSRTITLKKPDGTFVTTVAGPEVKRFAEIKLGQTVNAKYYENVVIRVKRPGEPDVDTQGRSATSSGLALP